MKERRLLNALGGVDDRFIEEAAPSNRVKAGKSMLKWCAVAACLCAAILGAVHFGGETIVGSKADTGVTVSEEGVYIPPIDVMLSAADGAEYDMIGFFIYQGRCYTQYEWIYEDVDFVGEYLGTATGLIDEWTPQEGYMELAGSVWGDFYSVKGFDPDFMLCMVHEDGSAELFINDNDITLKTGADLFEERLHLSNSYTEVRYETRHSWYYGEDEISTIDGENVEIIEKFIAAIDEAPFMRTEDIPLADGQSNIYDSLELYHVYFETESGVPIHLRLFEGGYVRFQGIMGACVKVDDESFDAFIDLLSGISE